MTAGVDITGAVIEDEARKVGDRAYAGAKSSKPGIKHATTRRCGRR